MKHIKSQQELNETQKKLDLSGVIDSISFNKKDSIITFEIETNGDINIITDSDYFNFLSKDDGQKLFNMLKKYYL